MIAARQEIELRPQLERLDRLVLASARVAPGALSFTFHPLWQMDAATKAATALQKAQATSIYAGLGLWPKEVMAGLVAGQLAEDGIYPDAGAAFTAAEGDGSQHPVQDYSPDQPRDPHGRWTEGGGGNNVPGTSQERSWSTVLGGWLNTPSPIESAEAHEIDRPQKNHSSGNNVQVLISQGNSGPLTPGGVVQRPVEGIDPLDPANLNTLPPSRREQDALASMLNLIKNGETSGLRPHPYENRPHGTTGAVLPPTVGGYTTYDVPLGTLNRGSSRVIIDNETQRMYYTNNHYCSFFPISESPQP